MILATASPWSGQAAPLFRFIFSYCPITPESCFPLLSLAVSAGPRPLPLPSPPHPPRADGGKPTITAIMANNDNAMARFLFAILEQKCLKDVSRGKAMEMGDSGRDAKLL